MKRKLIHKKIFSPLEIKIDFILDDNYYFYVARREDGTDNTNTTGVQGTV